ncbi:hypothetical protein BKA62DRAFT_289533 [Auriculariales sp. MPI-PUGE-AT-0066]|nr:hypothetical protein BKA62DRAFT_289533 [Auriculariales sp. MPI-PUGE-AT-0066]
MANALAFEPPPLSRAVTYHPTHNVGPPPTSTLYIDEPIQDDYHSILAPGPGSAVPRKRKSSPSPDALVDHRRLRRSHEACARCRSKKIKCDSNHPRCGSCVQANTECQQEDRHRQTLTLRGHQEQLEAKVTVCEALLRTFIPDFTIEALQFHAENRRVDPRLVDLLVQAGIVASSPHSDSQQRPHLTPLRTDSLSPARHTGMQSFAGGDIVASPLTALSHPQQPLAASAPAVTPTQHHYVSTPSSSTLHPESPPTAVTARSTPFSVNTPSTSALPAPSISSASVPYPAERTVVRPLPLPRIEVKGQDPNKFNMTDPRTMITSFDPSCEPSWFDSNNLNQTDREDTTVSIEAMQRPPREPSQWMRVNVAHPFPPHNSNQTLSYIFLPKDKNIVQLVVNEYFEKLNWHRPVFGKEDFEHQLKILYSGTSNHDPGFMMSVYLILALGTLSEMNQHLVTDDPNGTHSRDETRQVMEQIARPNWPKIDEFWARATAIKPDLRLTISSVQAIILWQWHLYIERHGRSLWRITGQMVRLGVELGLHHDPWKQGGVFTPAECRLRERLWCTILIHDRGTAVLLGRPVAIAPADTTSPPPQREKDRKHEFSDHFFHSFKIMGFQADILCELYRPAPKTPDALFRQCLRILKDFEGMRRNDLLAYRAYFEGPESGRVEDALRLLDDISVDIGLTLLKFWIAKLLALRVVFLDQSVDFKLRMQFLKDALYISHNIIVVHRALIKFPHAAFFVSPVPLHISAMTIIYGIMMQSPHLSWERSLDDVWLALSLLPLTRWRWERKDHSAQHPVISKLAEKVFKTNLSEKTREEQPGVLMPEVSTKEYDELEERPRSSLSFRGDAKGNGRYSATSTPMLRYASPVRRLNQYSEDVSMSIKNEYDGIHQPQPEQARTEWSGVTGLFYPFDQGNPLNTQGRTGMSAPAPAPTTTMTMAPPPAPMNYGIPYSSGFTVGCAPSHQSYITEENDIGPSPEMDAVTPIVTMMDQQGLQMLQDQTPHGSYVSGVPHFLPHHADAGLVHPAAQHHLTHNGAGQHHPVQMVPRGTMLHVFQQQQTAPPRMHHSQTNGHLSQLVPVGRPHQPQNQSQW